MEVAAGSHSGTASVSYSNEEVSHKTRRQMYIDATNSRMKCVVHSVYQSDTESLHGSHESFDTIDNEHYSTDRSFIDQVMLNSFYGYKANMLCLL